MKELKTFATIFAPGIALCFFFSINAVKIEKPGRLPAVESKDWYSQVKKGIEISVAKR